MKLRRHRIGRSSGERSALASIVFVVTLVAGTIATAVPPAAAQIIGPVSIDDAFALALYGATSGFDTKQDQAISSEPGGVEEVHLDLAPDGPAESEIGHATGKSKLDVLISTPDDVQQIEVDGSFSGSATADTALSHGISVNSSAGSSLRVSFSVDAEVDYSLQGSLDATSTDDSFRTEITAVLQGVPENGDPFVSPRAYACAGGAGFDGCTEPNVPDLNESGSLPTGNYLLEVTAGGGARFPGVASDGPGTADYSGDFSLAMTFDPLVCDNDFTAGPDDIDGTPGSDLLCGGDGIDDIDGGGGDDTIIGGAGGDVLFGGDDDDTIDGEGGQDFIQGGLGDDIILAGAGNDGNDDSPISGGDGDDVMVGGEGSDRIVGDLGSDSIHGGTGASRDTLFGCNEIDPLCQADQAGLDAAGVFDEDLIKAGPGGASMSGDAGEDTLEGSEAFDLIFGGPSNDLITGAGGGDLLHGDAGDDTLEGGGGHDSGNHPQLPALELGVFGGPGADVIRGNLGDDLLEGGDGADQLSGDGGGDTLRGQDAGDCLRGGTQKDVLVGGGGGDRLFARDQRRDVLNGGSGFDRAQRDPQLDALTNVENRNFQGRCPL